MRADIQRFPEEEIPGDGRGVEKRAAGQWIQIQIREQCDQKHAVLGERQFEVHAVSERPPDKRGPVSGGELSITGEVRRNEIC